MPPPASVPLRPASTVMRLSRLGSFHPTRLSFMPTLLRQMQAGGWRIDRPLWQIDPRGVGRALYRATGQGRSYSLVAFAHDLPEDQRSDRVIATAWDATFALFDGTPEPADLARLAQNVPRQEAGRVAATELTLSRANRSVRLWSYIVDCLARGAQPDRAEIDRVGYLMRTTAVYGSSKFGTADLSRLSGRPLLDGPFRAEMLTVWLIRAFTMDLVEHMARAANPNAARLAPDLRRRIGVGNSTGLGMAPFLVTHPALLHRWISARETALARVRALPEATGWTGFQAALASARENARDWSSDHPVQQQKLADLRRDLTRIEGFPRPGTSRPWDALWRWGEAHLSLEGQEQLLALLLAPHDELVDDLAEQMACDEAASARIDGAMDIADLRALIARNYRWARTIDHSDPAEHARFWYVSEEKLEPRLGERFTELGAEREQPLAIARDIARLAEALDGQNGTVAAFLLRHPQHRHVLRRVQMSATRPYAEIQDNLISAHMQPIDLLRAKLAMFGASRFDPRSDRWVRITMYRDAPL
ncbi:MAG: hypothetical protein AAFR17_20155, partial [Pseudomonadota bacterium]